MPTETPITAADVMTVSPRTCSPFSTVLEAVMIFRDANCGAVPIVQDGKLLGLLTDRDVALALTEYADLVNRSVGDIMSKDPITIPTTATVAEIEAKIAHNAIKRLMVVDASGSLVGIISWVDLTKYLSNREVGEIVTDVLNEV